MKRQEILFPFQSEMLDVPASIGTTLVSKTGSWRHLRPRHDNKLSPCNDACPAGTSVQKYLQLASQERFMEAWQVVREHNPFPSVCGRVCPHPCETACNRGSYDEPIAIHAVERFLGDYGSQWTRAVAKPERRDQQVAVVGSGPSGLSAAYHLARRGYRVKLIEGLPVLGGMMRVAIPAYRLPKDVLDREIQQILDLGVEVETGKRLGKDFSIEELVGGGNSAVFVGLGAQRALKMEVRGSDFPNVLSALDFLRDANAGAKDARGLRVAVIGGGFTAMDAARSSLRLGAAEAHVVYRRTRGDMRASAQEVHEAEQEGVRFHFNAVPTEVRGDGNAELIICQETRPGETGSAGRPELSLVAGTQFELPVDLVIMAIGQQAEIDDLPTALKGSGGLIPVAGVNGRTQAERVFAGGDAVTGPATIVQAIGAGRRAAMSIHRQLRGEADAPEEAKPAVVAFSQLNTTYFSERKRQQEPQVSVGERLAGMNVEVSGALDASDVMMEAVRCFSCGVCNSCDNCWLFCPDLAISRVDGHYEIDYDYCKGCGVCVAECPRDAMSIEEEVK